MRMSKNTCLYKSIYTATCVGQHHAQGKKQQGRKCREKGIVLCCTNHNINHQKCTALLHSTHQKCPSRVLLFVSTGCIIVVCVQGHRDTGTNNDIQ